ncbi:hypothetical protein [Algoriphagus vanfongensis]|uniref:hypothetical protein n=1 Tax=Algoriphagus vanfongensis TaxID=426371 RepID=UPI001B7FE9AC|nr:hypothetical protein [Algoriphagus vanfongensis]
MDNSYQYRLSANKKHQIAQNLINILEKDEAITSETKRFISDWILTPPNEKRKAFFDVWEIVLKNYLPSSRPILFRSFKGKLINGRISSFTGRIECAKRFSNGRGSLLICDTKETLKFDEKYGEPGGFRYSFYPIVDVLNKAKNDGGWGFSSMILNDHIGEDEYIMRIELNNMYHLKWRG